MTNPNAGTDQAAEEAIVEELESELGGDAELGDETDGDGDSDGPVDDGPFGAGDDD